MILLVVVCAGGLLLRAELPSVSLFVYLTAAARTSPPAAAAAPGHKKVMVRWVTANTGYTGGNWTGPFSVSPPIGLSNVLLLNQIQNMKHHINMLTVQNKREFMILFVPLTPSPDAWFQTS